MLPRPSEESGKHRIVWYCQKQQHNNVKIPWCPKCTKLVQNKHNKELHISDRFKTKRTHPCPSSECGEHHTVWHCRNEVHKKIKNPQSPKRAKLVQNKHNMELHISDPFQTKRTHPCPSSDCGKHHNVWQYQNEVHNKIKSPWSRKCAKLVQNKHNKELCIFLAPLELWEAP